MNPHIFSRSPSARLIRRARRVGKQVRRSLRPVTHHFTPDTPLERTSDWFRHQADRVDFDAVGDSFQRATQTSRQAVREHPTSAGAAAFALIAAALGLYAMRRHEPIANDYDDEYHRVIETPEGQRPHAHNPIERYPLSAGILSIAVGIVAAVLFQRHR